MKTQGWELRLHDLIEGRREALFSWGTHDCCMLAVDAIEACTGRRPAIAPYDSEAKAIDVLASLGGMREAASLATRSDPIAAGLAQRGDLVLIEWPGLWGSALAVCAGSVAYAASRVGLARVPPHRWLTAWRV